MGGRRLAVLLATIVTSVAALTGCTTPAATPSGPALTVGFTLEPPTLDPTTSDSAAIPQLLLYNVYETLVKMDSSGKIQPLLATDYAVSGDGKVYTFHLDPKAKFASGTPVDANAVVSGINRMRNAASGTIKAQMAIISDVQVTAADTVQVTLSRPSNFWIYDMTSTAGIIVDPAVTDMATTPMGSGPYQLGTWVKGDSITLVKNPAYWGTAANFDQVTFRYIPDANAMIAAMASSELDIIGQMTSPDALSMFSDKAIYTIISGVTNGEVVLGFNHTNPALANRSVRQAICHAIDRQGLVDTVWGGQGRLIGSMVVPTDPYYQDLSGAYPYDPAKAKTLLAAAGVKDLTLRLRVPVLPYATPAATYIASQLADVGIKVTVEELDFNSRWLPEVFMSGDYDMTIVAHMEPRDIVAFANPDYYWHYDNPDFQAQIKAADAAAPADFIPLMQKAAQTLTTDAAADWLFDFPNLVVARAGITGIGDNATTLSFDLTTIESKG